jgi:hypothetical protein
MDGPGLVLHLTLIRLLKGCISAYEKWVRVKARTAGLDVNKPPITMAEFVDTAIESQPELAHGLTRSDGSRPGQPSQDHSRRQQG